MKVALGITVENEALFLSRHLDKLCSMFDRVFVCDNGSTDGSVEIINRSKATLLQRDFGHGADWRENDAKNCVLIESEKYGYDWMMSLDADEMITREGYAEMMSFMSDENDLLVFPRIEFYGDALHFRQSTYPDYQGRGIRLGKGLYWRNQIHSVIYQDSNERSCWDMGNYTIVPTAQIYHYGWALAKERRHSRYFPDVPVGKDTEVKTFYGRQP